MSESVQLESALAAAKQTIAELEARLEDYELIIANLEFEVDELNDEIEALYQEMKDK